MTKKISVGNNQVNNIAAHTVKLTVSYVQKNYIPTSDLTKLIKLVHASLSKLDNSSNITENKPPKPAVAIKKSVQPDFIICLEDGIKLKMLKRHLRTNYDMNPDEYREKWGLSRDYPMVAPSYAAQRSALAKKIGLGRNVAKRKPAKNR